MLGCWLDNPEFPSLPCCADSVERERRGGAKLMQNRTKEGRKIQPGKCMSFIIMLLSLNQSNHSQDTQWRSGLGACYLVMVQTELLKPQYLGENYQSSTTLLLLHLLLLLLLLHLLDLLLLLLLVQPLSCSAGHCTAAAAACSRIAAAAESAPVVPATRTRPQHRSTSGWTGTLQNRGHILPDSAKKYLAQKKNRCHLSRCVWIIAGPKKRAWEQPVSILQRKT